LIEAPPHLWLTADEYRLRGGFRRSGIASGQRSREPNMSYEIIDAAIYLMPVLLALGFATAFIIARLPHAH